MSPGLHLGLLSLAPSTIKFKNNTFQYTDLFERRVVGELIASNNTNCVGVVFSVNTNNDSNIISEWRASYHYTDGDELPTKIVLSHRHETNYTLQWEYEITSRVLSTTNLGRNDFHPNRFARLDQTKLFTFRNGEMHRVIDGKLDSLSGTLRVNGTTNFQPIENGVIITLFRSLFLASIVACLILLLYFRNSNSNSK
jgi:hypothetical protein